MKFLDLTGLTKFWDKLKEKFAFKNLTYGTRGYITSAGSNPDLLLEKMKLGIIQLYQGTGVGIKLYEYDAGDEENATLVWDSSTLTGDTLTKFLNGQNLGTIYTSPAGKCVKAEYDGHTSGNYYYIRAFGIFMTPKQADNSHTATAVCTINGTAYKAYTVDTYGGLVTAVCPDANYTKCIVKFTPSAETTRMRFFGFRCLNTYDGTDAVLLGRASSASKLSDARKLAVSLSNTTTDTTFNGTADVTNIKVSGTLPVANGGTGQTTAQGIVDGPIQDGIAGSSQASSDVSDAMEIITTHVNGYSSTNKRLYRRNATKLWNYIKGKLTSVSGVNISGNAATASAAQTGSALETALSGKADMASNLTGATKTKITYNSQGIVTGGADLEASDIPTLPASKVGLGNVANTNITVSATNGVKDVTNNVTYKYTHPTSGANTSKGDTTAQTPGFGGTFKVLSATVDSQGHTTALADHTVTIPATLADGNEPNAGGRNGLMSREDKAKLNGISSGATNNGGDFKAVSAEASQGLTNTEKENARTNIGAQAYLKIQLVEYGTVQYSDITAILNVGKIPAVVYSNALYICDGNVYTVNSVNEYRFTCSVGVVDSPRIAFLKLRDSSAGWGSGVVTLATPSSVTTGLAGKEDRIATAFTSSTDYNDLIAHGLYEITNSPAVGTRNSPEGGRISLWANKVTDSQGYYVTQLAIGDDAYIRRTYNQGENWTDWTYIVESSNCKRILLDNAIGSEAGTLYII